MTRLTQFFKPSDYIEHEILRPLDHMRLNWELTVNQTTGRYEDEEDSFAWLFNHLIDELETVVPPLKYHDSEDRLGEHVQKKLNWSFSKAKGIWFSAEGKRLHSSDYLAMLEQGGFKIDGDSDLVLAASGRIKAAMDRGQAHFDDMERSHQVVLAGIMASILYHRDPQEDWYRQKESESGRRRVLTPAPHTTGHTDP